jgi:TP901 family phage tail tape measure protein
VATVGTEIGRAIIRVVPDTSGFGQTMKQQVDRSLSGIGRSMQATGASLTRSVTLPLAGAAAAIVRLGTDFEKNMSFVEGLVGESSQQIAEWSEQLIDLGPKVAKGPVELADSLYYVTSSGIDSAKAMEVVEASARAAAAGLGETGVIADTVTSVINAFGAEAYSATDATDILVAAVKEGKAEADEIAPVLGRLIPIAAAMGIGFEDVAATIAVFSRTGLDAAEASVSLNSIMSTLLKPSKQAQDALKDVGLSFQDLRDMAAKPGGLIEVMRLLDHEFRNNDEGLARIFPNVRAFRGVMNALAQDAGSVDEVFREVRNSTGDTDVAFQVASETIQFRFNAALSAGQGLLISIFEAMKPLIADGLLRLKSVLEDATDAWNGMSTGAQTFMLGASGIAATIGPSLIVLGGMLRLVGGLGLLLTPAGAVLTGLVLLGGALGSALTANEEFRDKFRGIVGSIKAGIERGDWPAVGRTIVLGIKQAIDGIQLTAADVVGRIAKKVFGDSGVAGSLSMHIERGDWASVGRTLAFAIGQALDNVDFSGMGDSITSAVVGLFENVNWSELGGSIGRGVIEALGTLATISGEFVDAFVQFLTSINWVDIGRAAVPAIIQLVLGIVDALTDPTVWYQALIAGGRWKTTLGVVVGFMFAPSRWVGGIAKALRKIPLAGRFLAWVVEGLSRIGTRIVEAGSNLFRAFGRGFTSAIGGGGQGIIGRLIQWVRDIPTWLSIYAGEFGRVAQSWMTAIGNWIGRHGPAQVVSAFRAVRQGIVNFLSSAGSWVLSGARRIVTALGNALRPMVSVVGRILTSVRNFFANIFSAIWTAVTNRMSSIANAIAKRTAGIRTTLARWGTNILTVVRNAWDRMWAAVSTRLSNIATRVRTGTTGIRTTISNFITTVRTAWDRFWTKVFNIASNIWDRITSGARRFANAFGNAIDRIKQAAAGPINWVINNVFNKLIQGWNNLVGKLGFDGLKVPRIQGISTGGSRGAGPHARTGGPIMGHRGRDKIQAWLTHDEHVWTPEEVRAAGGHDAVYKLRKAILKSKGGLRPEALLQVLGNGFIKPTGGDPTFAKGGAVNASSMKSSGFFQYVARLLRRMRSKRSVFEDFSFPGMGKAGGKFNDPLANLFYRQHPKFDWPGNPQTVQRFLRSVVGAKSKSSDPLKQQYGWTVYISRLIRRLTAGRPVKGDLSFSGSGRFARKYQDELMARLSTRVPGLFDGSDVMSLGSASARRRLLQALRKLQPKFALGGMVMAKAFARRQHGKPYIWGGVGPGGYDCSGYQSAIMNVLEGKHPHVRRFTTATIRPGAPGLAAGMGPRLGYSIGSYRGNPGHMAGTLGGVNVEAGGSPSRTKYSTGASGASHPRFTQRVHATKGGLGISLKKALKDWGLPFVSRAFDDIKANIPAGAIRGLVEGMTDKIKDSAFTVANLKKVTESALEGFRTGGPVLRDQAALLHKGERVLNKADAQVYERGVGGDINIRVFVGERELTDIVRVELDARNRQNRVLARKGAR